VHLYGEIADSRTRRLRRQRAISKGQTDEPLWLLSGASDDEINRPGERGLRTAEHALGYNSPRETEAAQPPKTHSLFAVSNFQCH
jgi:hypothetical protein